MDDSGPAVQDSGIEVTVTVTVSSHPVSASSSFYHVRINEDRVTDHHGQQGHQTCERDVPRGLHGLCFPSDEVCN